MTVCECGDSLACPACHPDDCPCQDCHHARDYDNDVTWQTFTNRGSN